MRFEAVASAGWPQTEDKSPIIAEIFRMVNSGRTSAAEAALLLGQMIAHLLVETGQSAIACRDSLLILRKTSSAMWSRMPLHRKLFTLCSS
jgi:hypothetical protein